MTMTDDLQHLTDRALLKQRFLEGMSLVAATVNVIEQGKIIQNGSADELTAKPATDFVAEFFHADVSDFASRDSTESP